MKQIVPYKTLQGALNALDNGGRFYNVFTKAKDEVITDSELYKAAGVFSGKAHVFLFFELALSDLPKADRDQVIQCLSPELRSAYVNGRRTAISMWFANGMSEYDVMVLAGHSSFATTHQFSLPWRTI